MEMSRRGEGGDGGEEGVGSKLRRRHNRKNFIGMLNKGLIFRVGYRV